MTRGEIVNAIINGFVALGTLALAAIAIYGDQLRSWLSGPKLSLMLENNKGSLFQNVRRIYYSLKVVNRRPSSIATNCYVQLKSLQRRKPNGEYAAVPLPYPLVMSWPPSEFTPRTMTVRRDQPVDFGFLEEGKHFMPNAREYPNNFSGVLQPRETMRYSLEVVSDQFVSPELQEFEVSWNGEWSENLEIMAKNLQIREVKA